KYKATCKDVSGGSWYYGAQANRGAQFVSSSSLFLCAFSGKFPWLLITVLELFLLLNSWHMRVELLFHEHQFKVRFISISSIRVSTIKLKTVKQETRSLRFKKDQHYSSFSSYTARLRVPKTLTRAQKEQRAIEVIQGLRLERCQDTMIGHIHKNMICIRFREHFSSTSQASNVNQDSLINLIPKPPI
ncbi:hypothetical protein IGI04_041876, partial [Brassica rapa subsp. trilocularis]